MRQRTESRSAPDNADFESQLARSLEISRQFSALGVNQRRARKFCTLPYMDANCRVQSASLGGPAIVPLAAAVSRPAVVGRLTMTQELIANMLGVRREGVTEAAGRLQKLGVITGFDHALRPRGIDAQHRADAVAVLLSDPQAGIFLATRLGLRATRGH